MKTLRQVLLGILAALVSSTVVIGSFSVAMVEMGVPVAQGVSTSSPTPRNTPSPLPPLPTTAPGEPTFTASPTPLPTATPITSTELPLPTLSCPHPADWIAITVQVGDSLAGLAQVYGVSEESLKLNNCLVVESLLPGTLLFVPGVMPTLSPSPTPTAAPQATEAPTIGTGPQCGPFPGWVRYTVRPGDTLSSLSQSTGATVSQLQLANCMGSSTVLRAGQSVFVPRLPAVPPTAGPTATTPPSVTAAPPSPTTAPPTATFQPPPTNTPLPPSPTRSPTNPPPPPTLAEPPPSSTPEPPTPIPNSPTPVPPTPAPVPSEAASPEVPINTQPPQAP